MANNFKLYATTLTTTNETTLLTVPTASTYIVGSIIICNATPSTDSTIDLVVTDSDQATDFNILNVEPILATISREILSRPLILENGDSLKAEAANASVYDLLISYMDRSRE